VAIVNDTTWSTIVGTWRPGRLELYVDGWSRLEYSSGDQHQRHIRHLPLGLGLLDLAGLQRRHRPDRVLRLVLDPRDGAALHADAFGFLRPCNELPALMGSAPPATPPSTGTGVVTFLMG
jgi:hypothetical protein